MAHLKSIRLRTRRSRRSTKISSSGTSSGVIGGRCTRSKCVCRYWLDQCSTGRSDTLLTLRLIGVLVDADQILDKPTFEDDQGINGDDEEAKEVENGEFCKPPPVIRKPVVKAVAAATKRASSSNSSSQEAPKKKTKKAKA